jgi:hypothetical protein
VTARQDHVELLFPSQYIKHVELKGKDVTLTIKRVELGELQVRGKDEKKRRGVIWFEETPKKMVLNRANAETIVKLYGKFTGEWVGRRITLYPDPRVRFGRDEVGGTRVRPKVPPPKGQREAPPDLESAAVPADDPTGEAQGDPTHEGERE